MKRRSFLKGMAGVLASMKAPAFVGEGVLMPSKELILPEDHWFDDYTLTWEEGLYPVLEEGLLDLKWVHKKALKAGMHIFRDSTGDMLSLEHDEQLIQPKLPLSYRGNV